MRWNILILTLFISVILITDTASAGIKGISKKPEIENNIPITVITGTEEQNIKIFSGGSSRYLYKTSEGKFEGTITPLEEQNGVIIEANNEEQAYDKGGCPNSNAYASHPYNYQYSSVYFSQESGNPHGTIFSLDTENHPDTGVIGICVYPSPLLNTGNGDTLKLLYIPYPVEDPDYWAIKHNNNWDYFGFGRHGGLNLIKHDGTKGIRLGSSSYAIGNIESANILIHIQDQEECSRDQAEADLDNEDNIQNTCWRRPGRTPGIPEFPTIAAPIAAVLGLLFLFQQRKRKEE